VQRIRRECPHLCSIDTTRRCGSAGMEMPFSEVELTALPPDGRYKSAQPSNTSPKTGSRCPRITWWSCDLCDDGSVEALGIAANQDASRLSVSGCSAMGKHLVQSA
jgi:hypothetical protein